MASRWFVFWIAIFVIGVLRGETVVAVVGLIYAVLTSAPKAKE